MVTNGHVRLTPCAQIIGVDTDNILFVVMASHDIFVKTFFSRKTSYEITFESNKLMFMVTSKSY